MLAFEQGVPPPHVLARTLVVEASTCSVDRLAYLLSFGADPSGTDAYGVTPLMEAARADNAPVVRELLARGATSAAASTAGEFALGIAAFHSSVAALNEMLRGGTSVAADPNAAGPDGRTALHLAACSAEARPDVVAFLMEHGASPLVMDSEGQTPLHALCAREKPDLPSGASAAVLSFPRVWRRLMVTHGAAQGRPRGRWGRRRRVRRR